MTTPQAVRRRERWILGLLVGVGVIMLIALGNQIRINASLENQTDKVSAAQLDGCRASLEPGGIRVILAEEIQDDINQIRTELQESKNLDYTKFFPGVPRDELDDLLKRQRDQQQGRINSKEERINDLLSFNCEARYKL